MQPRVQPRPRRVPLLLCALLGLAVAALAYAAAPRAESPPSSAAPANQGRPRVAFDGSNSLTVWEDERFGYTVSGSRVSPEGAILDPQQIWFAQGAHTESMVDVAFDGQNYLAAWVDDRVSGSGDIYATRIGTDGAVIDPDGFALSAGGCCRFDPALAFGDGEYLAVWSHPSTFFDIRGTRVTTAGDVLDPSGLPISVGLGHHLFPAVASDGTDYFVVWDDQRSVVQDEVYGTRVSADGAVLDPNGIRISSAAFPAYPAISFDGTNYLVVWTDERAGDLDIYACRVTPAGAVLDPDGIPIATGSVLQGTPSVAFDGTNYLVAWGEGVIKVTRVTPDGIVLDPGGISLGGIQAYLSDIAFGPENYLVVWEDGRGGWDIYGARVTPDGVVLDPDGFVVSTGQQPPPPPPPPPIEPPPPQPPPPPCG